MQTPDSQTIAARFFSAIIRLKEERKIRGIQTFTDRYGINRRNFYHLKDNLESDAFQVAWLMYLVRDFGVSSEWLITGEGEFYQNEEIIARIAKSLQGKVVV